MNPRVGDMALYHLQENGVDKIVEARVREVGQPWTTGTVPVRVSLLGLGHDRWVPLSLLDFEGMDSP